MKISYIFFGMLIVFLTGCSDSKTKNPHDHVHSGHDHSPYSAQDTIWSHKLIFPSKVPDRIILNLTEHPESSIAVNWRTDQQTDSGFVQIAVATDGPEFLLDGVRTVRAETEVFENKNEKHNEPLVKANYHSAVIDDLNPATTYVYRVGYGGDDDRLWSEWFQTTTASNRDNDAFGFIYFGDAQNELKSMWSRVIRSSYAKFPKVNFMLHAGDLVNDRDSNLEWGEWFYAGSFIHATIPGIMTPGNHEYRKEVLSSLWRPQFNLPQNGPLDEIRETCYYVDYQNTRIISIDAVSFDDKEHSRKAQGQWLDSILTNNPKKWSVIFLHYPVLSVAKKRGEDNLNLKTVLKPIIDKYKVDLVLTGHDHTYARGEVKNLGTGITATDDTGTIYAVSVSGPKMYDSEKADWMQRRGEYTQLFQIITIEGDQLSYTSYTPLGKVYDAFELVKHNGKKELINKIPNTRERMKKDFIRE
ncbi:3',5'-cyclic AMP phosphodiesterase CpdA [Sinomicrobium oceani]|uniref:3',5'-cyclic AMP phosphodiesterase CpdA n=1 Tax=Sinomicrobium oceani TaxID=1150368 RepID=A0A1K1MAP1_9FLAO|nr:metallophosphoesterase family protein [Sinomicrobium oceani]SFW20165.1 3',5'-cyclic AMP phosphodiesterase CpdA [Sinomicrobium oceani]